MEELDSKEVVIYRSGDGLVSMEAMLDQTGDTIWATQKAIASLFQVSVQNVSYHLLKAIRKRWI